MEKKLLRPKEAMEAIGIGKSKFYEMLSAGEISVVRIGRALRIPVSSLDEWIERNKIEASNGGAR